MEDTIRVADQVFVGRQPTQAELEQLQKDGFRTLINFRHDGEDEQPLSPEDEGENVERLKMGYLHLPISFKAITPAVVDRFRREMANIPKPLFAHCKTGRRAGLMMLMHFGIEQKMSGKDALAQAEALGFKCDADETKQFVIDYVESRSHAHA